MRPFYVFAQPSPVGSAAETPDDRATAFRPVEGGTQMQSGEKLLVEAYAAIWLIAFAFILLSWRRQRHIDRRIANLEGALQKARGAGEPDGLHARDEGAAGAPERGPARGAELPVKGAEEL